MSHSGQMFLSEIVPKFLFPYDGAVFRFEAENIIFIDSVATSIAPLFLDELTEMSQNVCSVRS